MTRKRDLKRRIRERQARTGDSYMVAQRHILASRLAEIAARQVPGSESVPVSMPVSMPVSVVEQLDVSPIAARLGFRCAVVMSPELAGRVEPARAVAALRDALVQTRDAYLVRLFGFAFGVATPEPAAADPVLRTLGRIGARRPLVFLVDGLTGSVPVVCSRAGRALALWVASRELEPELAGRAPSAATAGALSLGELAALTGSVIAEELAGAVAAVRTGQYQLEASLALRERATPVALAAQQPERAPRALFLLLAGRRYPVPTRALIIGREPELADVVIRDPQIASRHASVLWRNGTHYLKDLGSATGITYKGMRIDHKRIDEGDVFQLGDHALRFTYRSDG